MSSDTVARQFTAKQELFIVWYVKLLNATRAAKRAGYAAESRHALEQQGSRLLRKVEIKAEIDKRIKASIMGADELLSRITSTAGMDVTPYTRADGTLDVKRLGEDGLGHLVIGSKPGREGAEITLANPQTARKMLGRYHRILGADTQVDITGQLTANEDTLAALAQQIAAAQQSTAQQEDAQDRTA